MNILIFSWRGVGHPNAGGAEIATHEHAKAWVKVGHDITLFTSHYAGCKKREAIDGVQIIRSSRQLLGVQIAAFFWYIFGKHPKYDIVIDQFHGIPFFTPFFVKTKILAYIHEVATEVWKKNELPKPFNKVAAFVGPLIEPIIFRFYRKVDFLTVSDSTKNDLMRFGIAKNKITIIPNGINRVKVRSVKKDKIIAFLGALSQDKGVVDAIKIMSDVTRKDEEWKLIIMGRGGADYITYLKKIAKDHNVRDFVTFAGFVSEKKKFEILAKSFCLVNPSVHEGWGLVNVEANSVGTPVIAYKVKGIVDSVIDGKTGMLFEKGDFSQIALDIIKLSNDKKRYEALSKNCQKWSQKFSWEVSTKESTQLLENL